MADFLTDLTSRLHTLYDTFASHLTTLLASTTPRINHALHSPTTHQIILPLLLALTCFALAFQKGFAQDLREAWAYITTRRTSTTKPNVKIFYTNKSEDSNSSDEENDEHANPTHKNDNDDEQVSQNAHPNACTPPLPKPAASLHAPRRWTHQAYPHRRELFFPPQASDTAPSGARLDTPRPVFVPRLRPPSTKTPRAAAHLGAISDATRTPTPLPRPALVPLMPEAGRFGHGVALTEENLRAHVAGYTGSDGEDDIEGQGGEGAGEVQTPGKRRGPKMVVFGRG